MVNKSIRVGVVAETPYRESWSSTEGLGRMEVLILVAAVALVVSAGLAFLRQGKQTGQTDRCMSNLKEITLGFGLWMSDNDINDFPWVVYEPIQLTAERQNSWFQFGHLSNHLRSATSLADPGDARRGLRFASNWSTSPEGGFFHPSYRNNSCSYALFLDGGLTLEESPKNQTLVLDRHFNASGKVGDCARGFRRVPAYPPGTDVYWTKEVHGRGVGNIGVVDGSVHRITSSDLRRIIPGRWDSRDNSAHYLLPTSSSK